MSGSLKGNDLTLRSGTRVINGYVRDNTIELAVIDGNAKSVRRATR